MPRFRKTEIARYLEVLQLPDDLHRNGRDLARLQQAHRLAFSYDNLDLTEGRPLSLALPDLWDKLVCRRQGGIGLELNRLFWHLLSSLGYRTACFLARRYEHGRFGMRLHPVLRVQTEEGAFLCDVGWFGEAPRLPLRLLEQWPQQDGIASYWLERHPEGWVLMEQQGEQIRPLYCFAEDRYRPRDLEPMLFYCNHAPESPLKTSRQAAQTTPGGILLLNEAPKTARPQKHIQKKEV